MHACAPAIPATAVEWAQAQPSDADRASGSQGATIMSPTTATATRMKPISSTERSQILDITRLRRPRHPRGQHRGFAAPSFYPGYVPRRCPGTTRRRTRSSSCSPRASSTPSSRSCSDCFAVQLQRAEAKGKNIVRSTTSPAGVVRHRRAAQHSAVERRHPADVRPVGSHCWRSVAGPTDAADRRRAAVRARFAALGLLEVRDAGSPGGADATRRPGPGGPRIPAPRSATTSPSSSSPRWWSSLHRAVAGAERAGCS